MSAGPASAPPSGGPLVPGPLVPGEIVPGEEPVELNPGRPRVTVTVVNTGDRPVQIGSHYHFAAANPALGFDRDAARGHRLDVPAGTAVRFEPGMTRDVDLVPLAGARVVPGLRLDTVRGDTVRGDTVRGDTVRGEKNGALDD